MSPGVAPGQMFGERFKFERFSAAAILTNVTWLRTILVLTMAVLWLPLSVHCELEQIPALDFLACCPDEDMAPHQDDDCETDVCAVVESGLYKVEERQVALPAPDLDLSETPGWITGSALVPRPSPISSTPRSVPPPELPAGWRFAQRMALLPRAPSRPS